jgi:hypothetical protein
VRIIHTTVIHDARCDCRLAALSTGGKPDYSAGQH